MNLLYRQLATKNSSIVARCLLRYYYIVLSNADVVLSIIKKKTSL